MSGSLAIDDSTRPIAISGRDDVSDAEWDVRVDLAATHHLCVNYGWGNLHLNHISARVPDEPGWFLMKRHSVLFEEITASNLLKMRVDGPHQRTNTDVNDAGFTIHAGVLNARPDINCVLHIHSKPGMAFSAHGKGLLPMTQGAMRFYDRLAYHDYEGIADNFSEAERLAADLGPRSKSMILRNHGLLTCGVSAFEALTLMRYLVNACETQLMLEASGADIIIPPPETCEYTAKQWEKSDRNDAEVRKQSYLRYLDRFDTSYRE